MSLDDHTEGFDRRNLRQHWMFWTKRSIVTYRRYNDAYALWEGSDINIEAMLLPSGRASRSE